MVDIVHENGIWRTGIFMGKTPCAQHTKHGRIKTWGKPFGKWSTFMMVFSTSNCKYEGKSEVFSVCVMFFGLEGIHLFFVWREAIMEVFSTLFFKICTLIVYTTMNGADAILFWRLPNFWRTKWCFSNTSDARFRVGRWGTLQTNLCFTESARIHSLSDPFFGCGCMFHVCCWITWNMGLWHWILAQLIWQGTWC